MSGSLSAGQGVAAALPIYAGYYPREGSRAVSAAYYWGGTQRQFNEDLSALQSQGMMQTIQSVYVDNSMVEFPVTLQIRGTNQRFVVPGGYMGIFPVYFAEGPRYSIAGILSSGEGSIGSNVNDNTTTLIWLNIPCTSAMIWSASGSTTGFQMGAQVVSTGIVDPGSAALFVTAPPDARLILQSVTIAITFTTAPTAAGAVKLGLNDGNHVIANGRLGFAAGQATATLTWSNLNYLVRSVASDPFVNFNTFPTGAAGGEAAISTVYTLIPQIIGG